MNRNALLMQQKRPQFIKKHFAYSVLFDKINYNGAIQLCYAKIYQVLSVMTS